MQQSKKIKSIAYLEWLIKIIIATLAVVLIYKSVSKRSGIHELISSFDELFSNPLSSSLIILTVVLMLINWSLEAIKWQLMIVKVERVGFFRAMEAVFSGLTVSFFTPNRTGEFAGRIFQLKSADRIKASIITIIGNSSQLVMTVLTGSVALVFYVLNYSGLNGYWLIAGTILSLFIGSVTVFLFLNISLLENYLNRFKLLKKFHPYIEVFSYYSSRELMNVLGLSLLRHLIFSIQFYLLLELFGIYIAIFPALLMITLIFYAMTLIPTFFITELAVRGSVAIAFLGALSDNDAGIINSTVSLWLINLVVPALIGAIFVFTFRFRKQKSA